MTRFSATALVAAALCAPPAFGAVLNTRGNSNLARKVTDFIILGDSYSDSCNVFEGGEYGPNGERPHLMPPPNATKFPHCPPAPIGRSDGGRAWPEWIRIDQNQTVSSTSAPGGDATAFGQWNIVNLAQASATCDNAIWPRTPVPDIGQQTTLYQNRYNTSSIDQYIQSDPKTTTLAMFIGTNDVSLSIIGIGTVGQETDCIEQRLVKLHRIGFRNFLMVQNINLQDTPFLNTPKYRNITHQMVNENNAEQAKLFDKLKCWWRDDTIIDVFPAYDLFSAFYNQPKEYGFTYVNEPCNNCTNPDEHLWWDDLHPSSRAFHIFARKVERFVTNGDRGQSLIRGAEGL